MTENDKCDATSTAADVASERERVHQLLIDDISRGLADVAAGRTYSADAALAQLQRQRAFSNADHISQPPHGFAHPDFRTGDDH